MSIKSNIIAQVKVCSCLQAVQYANQARLNDSFAVSLFAQTRIRSLVALPMLALAFSVLSNPPLTMADLFRPPVLQAGGVPVVVVLAAVGWCMGCLVLWQLGQKRYLLRQAYSSLLCLARSARAIKKYAGVRTSMC